jgi:subtilisin family serine protease
MVGLMNPLDLVNLSQLMALTSGRPELVIGLIDGPVAVDHPDLADSNVRELPGRTSGGCTMANSIACTHGTFVAGILSASRNSSAPAICPDCTLLVRPIFAESTLLNEDMPSATPEELAAAILDCVRAGVHIINLSAAFVQPSLAGQRTLEEALNYAASRSVLVVAAAGNQGAVGSTVITRHPGVIPVVACDLQGRPLDYSNLGASIGRHGLRAPGEHVTSISAHGKATSFSGTSAATPFVTGAIALLWSQFPGATSNEMRVAMREGSKPQQATIVPPLLDGWGAYRAFGTAMRRRMQ